VAGDLGNEVRVVRVRGSHAADPAFCLGVGAPAGDKLLRFTTPLLGRRGPLIVGGPAPSRDRVVENQTRSPFRIGRCEQHAHGGGLEGSEQDCPLRTDGVEHRAQVVHPNLEGGRLPQTIGEPGPAAVEDDEPGESREEFKECCLKRNLVLDLDVAGEPVDEDEVRRSLARDRIGDCDVAALGVLDAVTVGHDRSVRSGFPNRKRQGRSGLAPAGPQLLLPGRKARVRAHAHLRV
jgi:hypothetical protein